MIVFAVACAMALLRVKALPGAGSLGIPATVWPILGSMFMFRLLVYLYDLKYKAATFSPGRAVGYFFMLPNVCFPLFPIVDYKTLQRSFYSEDALHTYQTGIKWMVRGFVQLMLYRWVYLRGVIEPSEVVTGLDAGRYILMTYLLYLRVSGSFHFTVGLLHMFGYSLPETHHLYLLSSSFTDFWRRINIYWKDFIQKLVFNPSYAALRRLGHERALALATLIAFVATWFFHSYQCFWIRGSFPVVWNDLVFWSLLALIVAGNVIVESRLGRHRSLKTRSHTLKGDAILALKTAATFASICLLWTIWSTPNLTELRSVGKALLNSSALDLAVITAVPLVVGVGGVLTTSRTRKDNTILALRITGAFCCVSLLWAIWNNPTVTDVRILGKALLGASTIGLAVMAVVSLGLGVLTGFLPGRKRETSAAATTHETRSVWFWPEAIAVCGFATIVTLVAFSPGSLVPLSYRLSMLAKDVFDNRLNVADTERLQRGYYEDLGDVRGLNDELFWLRFGKEPKGWADRHPLMRIRGDAFAYDYEPFSHRLFNGIPHTINSHGMRDREYTLQRPPRTFRIALIGASHEAGTGVRDNETYENLVEDRLNSELAPALGLKFEILNFSCWAYSPVIKLHIIEQKVFRFQPHAILYATNSKDPRWLFKPLREAIQTGRVSEFPFLTRALERAKVSVAAGTELPDWNWFQAKLQPYAEDTMLAIFERLREGCGSRGIRSGIVVLQTPADGTFRPEILDRLASLGQGAGLPVLDLCGAFSGVDDLKSLWILPWDDHTNAVGHRLLADRFYQQLIEQKIVPRTRTLAPNRWCGCITLVQLRE